MMMMMINSTILESDSDKRLCLLKPQHDLVISENFDDINNNHYEAEKSLLECNNTMKQDILSSNDHENNTTLLTTTTTTTTVEFKVKTTKTSSRKRKLNLMNDINHDNSHKQQAITKKKKKQRVTKQDHNDQKKNHSKTVDQSSGTDESSFGSCEPGTSVVLQGIVWNETDKGVLVVNITWRGKTYVGALLNTTEQNWAPPRYKSDIRSMKPNPNRDHQLPSIPSTHESTERILRNGKRRGSSATVTPSSTTKTRSFKIPETPPPSSKADETLTTNEKLIVPPSRNMNEDDETGDNDSSRSVSPTTSGISTTSSSPPLSNNNENSSLSNPVDLSNSKTKDPLIPYHFPNDLLFSTSTNSSDYFSSTNSFNLSLSSTSSTVSPSSYCPIPSEIYFNSLPSVSSLSKSSH